VWGMLLLDFGGMWSSRPGVCLVVGVGILSCNGGGRDWRQLSSGILTHGPSYHEQIILCSCSFSCVFACVLIIVSMYVFKAINTLLLCNIPDFSFLHLGGVELQRHL
jgi:hypothetical protein